MQPIDHQVHYPKLTAGLDEEKAYMQPGCALLAYIAWGVYSGSKDAACNVRDVSFFFFSPELSWTSPKGS